MALIPIRDHGEVVAHALVDEGDYERMNRWRWRLHKDGYAMRTDSSHRTMLMHRAILDLEPGDGSMCDHRNRDPLDNRRHNLRLCPKGQMHNQQNTDFDLRGVSPVGDRWRGQARIEGRNDHVGCFDTAEEAAQAVAEYRAFFYGSEWVVS